jgi:hypothetical protein
MVSGEYTTNNEIEKSNVHNESQLNDLQTNTVYCNECGKRFSEKMMKKMQLNGTAFCVHCGKEVHITQFQISLVS